MRNWSIACTRGGGRIWRRSDVSNLEAAILGVSAPLIGVAFVVVVQWLLRKADRDV
jgi:hypothetical protein